MLANKLNYGDTIGVVGVSNSLFLNNKYNNFIRAKQFFENKNFKIKFGKYVERRLLWLLRNKRTKSRRFYENVS